MEMGGPLANYEEKVLLRGRASAMGPEKKAAHLLLHMSDVARKVCLSAGRYAIVNLDGAEKISKILRGRYAPDAIDSNFQDMVELMYFQRTGQNMDTYIMEFEMLREKAESRMVIGSGPPDAFVSALCMQNAASTEHEKTMVLGSLGKTPWLFPRCRRRCDVCLAPAGTPHDRMYSWRKIWIRCPKRKISRHG